MEAFRKCPEEPRHDHPYAMRQVLPRKSISLAGTLRLLLVGMMLFVLCAPLSANLPYDCVRCSGTSECDCDGEGAGDDLSIDGDEDGVFGDGINDGDSSRGGASFGSLRFSVPFGVSAHEPLRLGGQFSLYAVSASSLVYTTQYLQYRNRLLDRILQTEVSPAYKERILGSDWESRLESLSVFGRVVTDSSLKGDVTHQVRLLGAKREPIVFQFTLDDPVGRPIGEKATLRLTLRMRNASGNDTTSVPVYYDLCFGDGSSVRYAASDGRVISCTTSKGRTVTPEEAGLEAIWDDSGLIRQVRSDRDGLADVVAFTDTPGYEIRLYDSSQITGKGEDGLYTVAGEPHTIWRVSNPNAGTATHVHVTRSSGGTEETTVYEYSSNVEGWMKTSPDRATVVSSTSTVDLSRTLRTVTVVERTRTGTVASRTRNLVRKYPFGERLVSSTKDPDGANLQSVWEYYADSSDAGSYGRRKSESRPDGGWTLWRYDAQGRVSAEVTPWKNAAFGADDAEAQVVLRFYEPVDSRDTVAVTDTRPRTEETRILGVITSKTYHAYYTDNGCRVEVTERCARPNASYGDADNLRTVKRWYPAGDGSSASAGRLHTVLSEDGLLSTYEYERGSWASGDFVVGSGNALRTTETRGTAEHPEGIAFRTLRLVTVLDAAGNRVYSERQVWTGEDYERVDRTERSFDGRNRLVRIEKSNGEITENTWNCCSKASETTSDGKTYLYEYDTQQRLVAKTLRAAGSRDGICL
jgi:YD repeat-containing protein